MFAEAIFAFSLQPSLGLGTADLDWSIAGGPDAAASPNILSELTFSELRSASAGLDINGSIYWPSTSFAITQELHIDGGTLISGHGQDADYGSDNRTDLYSLSSSEIEGDQLLDGELGIGIQSRRLINHHFGISAGGFLSEHALNFQNGRQLFASTPIFSGTTIEDLNRNLRENLDSDYQTRWSGGWLAFDYRFLWQDWTLGFRWQYFDGSYYGEGRWNLRATGIDAFQQPRSFSHYADATGQRLKFTIDWSLTENADVTLAVETTQWEAEPGYVITYFVNVLPQLNYFNGAQWDQQQLTVGYRWRF